MGEDINDAVWFMEEREFQKLTHVVRRVNGTALVISDSMEGLQQSFGHPQTPYYPRHTKASFCIVDATDNTCAFYKKSEVQSGTIVPLEEEIEGLDNATIIEFFQTHCMVPALPKKHRKSTSGVTVSKNAMILGVLSGPVTRRDLLKTQNFSEEYS